MSSSLASTPEAGRPWWSWLVGGAMAVLLAVAAWAFSEIWRPPLARLLDRTGGASSAEEEHDHEQDDAILNSIALSPQARRNIGLVTGQVRLQDFSRRIAVPAMVVARPGRTLYTISAPMTGVVMGVHTVRGEAVNSGKLLFTLRLTHEDLVQAQTEFLRTLGQLDVENRELARLEKVANGAVAGRVVLERQYERDKLQALLKAQREALRLHGLSDEQVNWIVNEGRLLREVQIFTPSLHDDDSLHHDTEPEHDVRPVQPASTVAADETPHARSQRFVVEELPVQPGQAVAAGEALCVLADYAELFLEGRAFEQDAEQLTRAAEEERRVSAISEQIGQAAQAVDGLEIVYVANEVDLQSRALHFYVALPNSVVRDAAHADGRHFLTWKYKPGQRMQLRVPVETWKNVLVLPVDAVAQEGPETFVFVQNGDHFDRRPVQVQYRDQYDVVVANDGSLFPGETVAVAAAHQLQMALKNQAGGGVDPHAGHQH